MQALLTDKVDPANVSIVVLNRLRLSASLAHVGRDRPEAGAPALVISAAISSRFSLSRAARRSLDAFGGEFADHGLAKPRARSGDDRDALAEIDRRHMAVHSQNDVGRTTFRRYRLRS